MSTPIDSTVSLVDDLDPLMPARASAPSPDARPWVVPVIALLLAFESIAYLAAGVGASIGSSGPPPFLAWGEVLGNLLVAAIFGLGLARRHPLLHRYYWLFSPFIALAAVINLFGASGAGEEGVIAGSLLMLVVHGAISVGVRTVDARRWFGLQCPTCGSQKVAAASLLIRRLRCRGCGHRWDRRAVERVDVAAFD